MCENAFADEDRRIPIGSFVFSGILLLVPVLLWGNYCLHTGGETLVLIGKISLGIAAVGITGTLIASYLLYRKHKDMNEVPFIIIFGLLFFFGILTWGAANKKNITLAKENGSWSWFTVEDKEIEDVTDDKDWFIKKDGSLWYIDESGNIRSGKGHRLFIDTTDVNTIGGEK